MSNNVEGNSDVTPETVAKTSKETKFKTKGKDRSVSVVIKFNKSGNERVKSPDVDRIQLLNLLEQAGLMPSMLQFVTSQPRQFTLAGVKEARNLHSLNLNDVRKTITNMKPEAFVIIENWFLKTCDKELEKYVNGDTTLHLELQDLLAGHMLHVRSINSQGDGGVAKPTNQPTRARLLIAALYNRKLRNLAKNVLKLGDVSLDEGQRNDGGLQSMRGIVFNPSLDIREHENSRSNLNIFIIAAIAIRVRNFKFADKMMNLLKRRNETFFPKGGYELLMEEYEKIRPQKMLPDITRTVSAVKEEFDKIDDLEVLAQVTKITDGEGKSQTGFSNVIAVRRDNTEEWKECTTEEFARLFPDRGSIVHLVGPGNPGLPKPSSHAVWGVMEQQFSTERQKEHKTNIKAVRKICPAWQILSLENINSTDTDKVRGWITSHFESLENLSEGEILLYFADGLYGHTSSSYVKLMGGKFTQNLRAWKNLPVIETSTGKVLHLGELPDTEIEIDLSPPYESLIKAVREQSAHTNADRQKFAQILRDMGSHQALAKCIQDINLDSLDLSGEQFEKLEHEILKLESVQKMLSSEREKVVHEAEKITAKEREELEKIMAREKEIQTKIDQKEEHLKNSKGEMKQLIKEMSQESRKAGRNQAIKAMFKRGFEEGIEEAVQTAETCVPERTR